MPAKVATTYIYLGDWQLLTGAPSVHRLLSPPIVNVITLSVSIHPPTCRAQLDAILIYISHFATTNHHHHHGSQTSWAAQCLVVVLITTCYRLLVMIVINGNNINIVLMVSFGDCVCVCMCAIIICLSIIGEGTPPPIDVCVCVHLCVGDKPKWTEGTLSRPVVRSHPLDRSIL